MTRALEVLDPGLSTLVQDAGRPGWAHVGVGRSGAADRAAWREANRAVGNDDGAAALEVLLGGVRLRALADLEVALAGARVGVAVEPQGATPGAGSVVEPGGGRLLLAAGSVLVLARPERGVRTYVAVRGGLDLAPVLGSRASDRLGGIGPAPLAAGDVIPVGRATAGQQDETGDGSAPRASDDEDVDVVLRIEPGPHEQWFEPRWPAVLCAPEGFVVAPSSDRVAVRLEGAQVARTRAAHGRELAPVGLVHGAVQVPPDGRPVVFGVDHPVTGGYPVLAVVRSSDLDLLGQVRPGDVVRLALSLPRGR